MHLKTAMLAEMVRTCGYALFLAADLVDRNEDETLGSMIARILPPTEDLREASGRLDAPPSREEVAEAAEWLAGLYETLARQDDTPARLEQLALFTARRLRAAAIRIKED